MSVEKITKIWPEWKVLEEIGEGAFGKVYKAVREEHSMTTYSAVKVITIPQNSAEITALKTEGLDENDTKTYFSGIVNDFINEIKLMESMKGITNIVSVEDYKVVEKKDVIGWDIYIRMELLTPFNEYLSKNKMAEAEVIKLGIDICTALELCAQKNIIHRDIKPENIFVSNFGDFKVGDFGIARELEKTNATMSSKGTPAYTAPEVALGKKYNASVDTYSLGIVLYKLLNNNKLPFIDQNTKSVRYSERKEANDRRLAGEKLPKPVNASEGLAGLILRACAYEPSQRFTSATEFKNALIALQNGQNVDLFATMPAMDLEHTHKLENEGNNSVVNQQNSSNIKQKKKNFIPVIIAVIAVVVLGASIFGISRIANVNKNGSENNSGIVDSDSDSTKPGSDITNSDLGNNIADNATTQGDKEEEPTENINEWKDKINTIVLEFKDEKTDYFSALFDLEDIEDLNINGLAQDISKAKEDIETLYDSRQAYDTAVIYEESEDYLNAIKEYEKVADIDTNYKTARKQVVVLKDKYRTQILEEAQNMATDKDYIGAIDKLNTGLALLADDVKLTKQISIYENEYAKEAIAESKKLMAENKFDEAVKVIEEAQLVSKNNSSLIAQIDVINKNRPKNFMDVCKPYDNTADEYVEYLGDATEGFLMAGTERKNGFSVYKYKSNDGYYILSNLNANYTVLEFDVGHVDGTRMNDATLMIYLDDVMCCKYEIKADAYPQHIVLDVTDKKQIKFYLKTEEVFGYITTGFADMTIR